VYAALDLLCSLKYAGWFWDIAIESGPNEKFGWDFWRLSTAVLEAEPKELIFYSGGLTFLLIGLLDCLFSDFWI
jgi:hypothetical protein